MRDVLTRPALLLLPLVAACGGGRALRSDVAARCVGVEVAPAALRAHVEALAGGRFAPRDVEHPEQLDRAAAWIAAELRRSGAAVREQVYQVEGRTYRNVIADVGPDTPERVIVGAHYDTAGDQPGADDDASGVAAILELARLLVSRPPPMRVELAAWTLEEPPTFRTPWMGSAVHAAALAAAGTHVRVAVAVEMIGAFSDEKGSQEYPAFLGLFYPSTASFAAVVGKWGQGAAVSEVARALRAGTRLPIETLSAPSWVRGIDFSDHRSFWAHGYDARDGHRHVVLPERPLPHARRFAGHARLRPDGGGGEGAPVRRAGRRGALIHREITSVRGRSAACRRSPRDRS
jgi:hypothetical protein